MNTKGIKPQNTATSINALLATLLSVGDSLGVGQPLSLEEARMKQGNVIGGYALSEVAIAAVRKDPMFGGSHIDADKLESSKDRIRSLTPFSKALHELVDRVDGAILSEKSDIGAAAMTVYRFLNALDRTERHEDVAPFVDAMKRINRRTRTKKETGAQTNTTQGQGENQNQNEKDKPPTNPQGNVETKGA
jgi:hypothetical protein